MTIKNNEFRVKATGLEKYFWISFLGVILKTGC